MSITKHIQQPKTMPTCGQCCLAMLAGVPLAEAVSAVGHRRGTTKQEIVFAAVKLGLKPISHLWQLPDETNPLKAGRLVLIKSQHPGRRNWHWVCSIDGVLHDPSQPVANKWGRDQKIVSYMVLEATSQKVAA